MTSSATASSKDDAQALKARIAALEAENERLASLAETAPIDPLVAGAEPVPRKRNGWRAFVSALCIVIASILVPVSVVGAWARVELVDPDQFVSTFGPLVDDPDVQAMVIDQVTTAVNEQIDIATITNDLFDGIAQLDLPPRALAAIDLLRTPAIQGVEGLIDQTVTRVVESTQFEDIWDSALRASHRGLVAAATGGQSGAVVIEDDGTVGIQLGPIVAEVKQRLVDRGVTFASAIPEVNRTIVVAQSDSLATIRVVYNLAVTAGYWIPVLMLALFIAGIAVARRKTTAVLGSGIGLALGGLILVIALSGGVTVVGITAGNLGLPSGALTSIYEQVVGAMRQTAVVLTVLGIVIAVFAWTQGRWAGSVATRRAVTGLNDSIRGAVFSRGAHTGGFGLWMDRQRVLVRIVIAVLAVIWLWLLRPLGVGEIFMVVLVALLVWWICELVRRPSAEVLVVDAEALDPDASVDAEELERVGQAPAGAGTLDVVREHDGRTV